MTYLARLHSFPQNQERLGGPSYITAPLDMGIVTPPTSPRNSLVAMGGQPYSCRGQRNFEKTLHQGLSGICSTYEVFTKVFFLAQFLLTTFINPAKLSDRIFCIRLMASGHGVVTINAFLPCLLGLFQKTPTITGSAGYIVLFPFIGVAVGVGRPAYLPAKRPSRTSRTSLITIDSVDTASGKTLRATLAREDEHLMIAGSASAALN